MRRLAGRFALAGCLLAVAGPGSAAPGAVEPRYRPEASIQELMDAVIDVNADAIWDAVATVETAAGTEEHQPHTDGEWQALRRQAIALQEGVNLLLIPGRKVAKAYVAPDGQGVYDSREVERAIARKPAQFLDLAHRLHDAAGAVLHAIDARDAGALLAAGGRLDAACEKCHSTFWYPNQHIPGAPALAPLPGPPGPRAPVHAARSRDSTAP